MRNLLTLWVAANAGYLGFMAYRYIMKQRALRRAEIQLQRAVAMVREHEHQEALYEDSARGVDRKNMEAYHRLYQDIVGHKPMGRVRDVVFQTGMARGSIAAVEVRAHCVEEAAEVISQSEHFIRRSAA